MKKNLFKKRKKVRMYVLQSMYIWSFNDIKIDDIKYNLLLNKNFNKIDIIYYDKLFYGILNKIDLIDKYIIFYGRKKISDIDIIELNIIRIAIFEFIFCKFIPYKVILSEAFFLSKIFGSFFSYSFINEILNSVVHNIKFFYKKII